LTKRLSDIGVLDNKQIFFVELFCLGTGAFSDWMASILRFQSTVLIKDVKYRCVAVIWEILHSLMELESDAAPSNQSGPADADFLRPCTNAPSTILRLRGDLQRLRP
jgi:hypothetical protein